VAAAVGNLWSMGNPDSRIDLPSLPQLLPMTSTVSMFGLSGGRGLLHNDVFQGMHPLCIIQPSTIPFFNSHHITSICGHGNVFSVSDSFHCFLRC